MAFQFGDITLDPEQLELRQDGVRIALEPQAFDVLVYLVHHRDRVVTKEELMDRVWGGRFVSETAVTSRIKQIRRAVGDDGRHQASIRTYHGRGYRFVAPVTLAEPSASPTREAAGTVDPTGPPPGTPVLTWRWGSAELRFQLSGQGPPDVLLLPAAPSLDAEWDGPRGALLRRLGAMARVIRHEAPAEAPSDLQQVRQVLEAAASARCLVLAVGDGAALATQVAAGLPERVTGLVLLDAAIEGDRAVDDRLLAGVRVPTLVLHPEPGAGTARARALASRLPDAEFRPLPAGAPLDATGAGSALAALGDFVDGLALEQAPDRYLTALVGLHGDDVDSLASVLTQLGGRLRQGPERAVVVSFDGPANALAALGSRRARGLRLGVGVGLAIDEVPRDSLLVSGHGVDVARLFARHARPGDVLLPNVIKDLLAGSGLRVETLTPLDLPHVGPHPVHRWLPPS